MAGRRPVVLVSPSDAESGPGGVLPVEGAPHPAVAKRDDWKGRPQVAGQPHVTIDIRAQTAAFKRQMDAVTRTLKAVRDRMAGVARVARRMLLAGGAAIGGLLALAGKQEDAERRLAAVLRATGNASGYTVDQLKKQAAALQKLTRYGDEAIMPLMAMLAAYKEIHGPVFQDAIRLTLDIADAFRVDAATAAKQLGKALNDPIKGLRTLRDVGISFTAAQIEEIKALQESGQLLKAQTMIIAELEARVGGVAEALGKTFLGRLIQLKNELGDVGELIGRIFIPDVSKAAEAIRKSATRIADWVSANKDLILTTTKVVAGIAGLIVGVHALTVGLQSAVTAAIALGGHPVLAALGALAAAVLAVKVAVKLLEAALRASAKESERFAEAMTNLAKARRDFEAASTTKGRITALQNQRSELERLIKLEEDRAHALREKAGQIEEEPPWRARAAERRQQAEMLMANALTAERAAKRHGDAIKELDERIKELEETQRVEVSSAAVTEKTEDFITALKRERDALGATGLELELIQADIKNLTDEQRVYAEQLYAEIEAHKDAERATERAYDCKRRAIDKVLQALDEELDLLNRIGLLNKTLTQEDVWRDELQRQGLTNEQIKKRIALLREEGDLLKAQRGEREIERQRERQAFQPRYVTLTGLHRQITLAAARAQKVETTPAKPDKPPPTPPDPRPVLERIHDLLLEVKQGLPLVGAFGA
jgi:hypothetical protein